LKGPADIAPDEPTVTENDYFCYSTQLAVPSK
jgi:hypothetical protein